MTESNKPGKPVDKYAQELKMLFRKVYPIAQQGNQETGSMDKSVFAFQFVQGLRLELKAIVAGVEGDFLPPGECSV